RLFGAAGGGGNWSSILGDGGGESDTVDEADEDEDEELSFGSSILIGVKDGGGSILPCFGICSRFGGAELPGISTLLALSVLVKERVRGR
ncbi:hypothetical protein LINPERHAP1_LOCUS1416, partial [Linum perenne]